MKKLMIAAAVAMLGIAANAVSYGWGNPAGLTGYTQEGPVGATVYLMQGDVAAATTFVETLLAANDMGAAFSTATASAVNYASFTADSTEMTGAKTGTWNTDNEYLEFAGPGVAEGSISFFQVAWDAANKALFVSENIDIDPIDGLANNELAFWNEGQESVFDGADTYQGSGWYTAATAAPEPTSGLLLLLGVAGLALRRRRA